MRGAFFGDKHSFRDYGLLLTKFENPLPEPKTYYVNVPGRDGSLDLSGYLSTVKYERRILKFEFTSCKGEAQRYLQQSAFFNDVHGKEKKIILDDDFSYYYIGRIRAKEWEAERDVGRLKIEVDAEPFKYDVISSIDEWLWDSFSFQYGIIREYKNIKVQGSLILTVPGSAVGVTPVFITDSIMTVKYKNITRTMQIGKNTFYDIYLEDTVNTLTFTGTGTVSLDYRGGSL